MMGRAAKVAQFWRSFLVAAVPLAALPLLFVHSEGKVNIALSSSVKRRPCGVRNPRKHEAVIVCQLGLLRENYVCLT